MIPQDNTQCSPALPNTLIIAELLGAQVPNVKDLWWCAPLVNLVLKLWIATCATRATIRALVTDESQPI